MPRSAAEMARVVRICQEAQLAGYRPSGPEDVNEALAVISNLPADEYRRVMNRIDNPDD